MEATSTTREAAATGTTRERPVQRRRRRVPRVAGRSCRSTPAAEPGFGTCGCGAAPVSVAERVAEEADELRLFRSFQNQPAQRDRSPQHQLHRFMGTRSGRKIHYARLLVMALDPSRVPLPLDRLLARV